MADVSEIATTVAAGGISAAAVAKIMLNNFLKRLEKDSDLVRSIDRDVAVIKSQLIDLKGDITGVASMTRRQFEKLTSPTK